MHFVPACIFVCGPFDAPVQELPAPHKLGDNEDLLLGNVDGIELDAVRMIHLWQRAVAEGSGGSTAWRAVAQRSSRTTTSHPHLAEDLDLPLETRISTDVARLVHYLHGERAAQRQSPHIMMHRQT
jgi:hypothetical protein